MVRYTPLALLLSFVGTAFATNHVLAHETRLPMSLSAVLADMEAEGLETLSPCLLIAEEGVDCASLLSNLIECDADECEGILTGAVGSAKGLAVALPNSAYEAMATVEACSGAILYAIDSASFAPDASSSLNLLAPAVERVINSSDLRKDDGKSPMIVIVQGSFGDDEKATFLSAANAMLANLVQPSGAKVKTIEDVFAVRFVPAASAADVIGFLSSCEPAVATAGVATAVASMGVPAENSGKLSPIDVAASLKLGPASAAALELALTPLLEESNAGLISNFGLRVNTALKTAGEEFDKAAGEVLKNSAVGKRKRSDLLDEVLVELEAAYDDQLQQLRLAAYEKYRQSLSSLRISPNLPSDLDEKLAESVKEFAEMAKKLKPAGTSWSSNAAKLDYRNFLKESNTERLKAARLSGAYKELPRKGITLGFHWLIPKPFGTDLQQTPSSSKFDPANIVYTPPIKRVDISGADVMEGTGAWKDQVTPSMAGSAMVYKNEEPQDEKAKTEQTGY